MMIFRDERDEINYVNSRLLSLHAKSLVGHGQSCPKVIVHENTIREQGWRFAEQQLLARLWPIADDNTLWEK